MGFLFTLGRNTVPLHSNMPKGLYLRVVIFHRTWAAVSTGSKSVIQNAGKLSFRNIHLENEATWLCCTKNWINTQFSFQIWMMMRAVISKPKNCDSYFINNQVCSLSSCHPEMSMLCSAWRWSTEKLAKPSEIHPGVQCIDIVEQGTSNILSGSLCILTICCNYIQSFSGVTQERMGSHLSLNPLKISSSWSSLFPLFITSMIFFLTTIIYGLLIRENCSFYIQISVKLLFEQNNYSMYSMR